MSLDIGSLSIVNAAVLPSLCFRLPFSFVLFIPRASFAFLPAIARRKTGRKVSPPAGRVTLIASPLPFGCPRDGTNLQESSAVLISSSTSRCRSGGNAPKMRASFRTTFTGC